MMPRAVKEEGAQLYEEQMKKPNLVFLTKENEARLKEKAKREGKKMPFTSTEEKPDATPNESPQSDT